jgi:hypothetical protein
VKHTLQSAVLLLGAFIPLALTMSCDLTEPSKVGEQQVRATVAVADSTVMVEGWLEGQGASYVTVRSCDGTQRWILYGTFVLENTEVCR